MFVGGTGYVKGPRSAASQRLEAHLKYIRYRAEGEGEGPRTVFGETDETLSLREAHQMILEQGRDGLRFHKIVISPAADERVADWQAFARRVMDDLGRRLGLKLTWCATVHQNTDHPHVHIVLAGDGERADGQVVQARLYTPHYEYLRERAQWHTEQAWDAVSEQKEVRVQFLQAVETHATWTYPFGWGNVGAGGHWPHSREAVDPSVVRQTYPQSCVSASGELLLGLLNFPTSRGAQERIVQKIGGAKDKDWVDFTSLIPALNDEVPVNAQGTFWGGHLDIPPEQRLSAIDYYTSKGPWVAELKSTRQFHAVVVDGRDNNGDLIIKDSYEEGTRYTMKDSDFVTYWMSAGVITWLSDGEQ